MFVNGEEVRVRVIGVSDNNYALDRNKIYTGLYRKNSNRMLVIIPKGEFAKPGWGSNQASGIPKSWKGKNLWSFRIEAIEIVSSGPLRGIYE